jgi:stalled ribosome alternative rescue factor ArfA
MKGLICNKLVNALIHNPLIRNPPIRKFIPPQNTRFHRLTQMLFCAINKTPGHGYQGIKLNRAGFGLADVKIEKMKGLICNKLVNALIHNPLIRNPPIRKFIPPQNTRFHRLTQMLFCAEPNPRNPR